MRRRGRLPARLPLTAIGLFLLFAAVSSLGVLSPSVSVAPALGIIVGAAALEHPTRAQIIAHLRLLPGDHFRSIVRSVRKSVGETRHHLNILMRRGAVREIRTKGLCRYYATGLEMTDRNQVFERYWTHRDYRARVLKVVCESKAATPSGIATQLGISRQLATYHLRRLVQAGHVERRSGGYAPTPRGGLGDPKFPARVKR